LDQWQGGFVPSEHTTVVVEFCGTTIVVLAGAGGLLLLIHPDNTSIGMAIMTVAKIFMGHSSK
jgi:hypothetical protein